MVKESGIVLHEANEPYSVADLLDTNLLAGGHGAQADLSAFVTDAVIRLFSVDFPLKVTDTDVCRQADTIQPFSHADRGHGVIEGLIRTGC